MVQTCQAKKGAQKGNYMHTPNQSKKQGRSNRQQERSKEENKNQSARDNKRG